MSSKVIVLSGDKLKSCVDNLAKSFAGRTKEESLDKGMCVMCDDPDFEFKDDVSLREYHITAMCQKCQDAFENQCDEND